MIYITKGEAIFRSMASLDPFFTLFRLQIPQIFYIVYKGGYLERITMPESWSLPKRKGTILGFEQRCWTHIFCEPQRRDLWP
jgi:hypothetical protein